jgi:hypothetical protein
MYKNVVQIGPKTVVRISGAFCPPCRETARRFPAAAEPSFRPAQPGPPVGNDPDMQGVAAPGKQDLRP